MKPIARLNDEITGITAGEHNGHIPPHPPCEITGNIISNVSDFVFIEGIPIAKLDSVTIEYDCCDSGQNGKIIEGSSLLFVNNIPVARLEDKIQPHNGTGNIKTANDFVFSE